MALDIIDLHCDTMMACYFKKQPLKNFEGHINIEKLQKGGCMAQALALFLPTDGHLARDGRTPWQLYKDMLVCWNENVDANADVIRRAFCADDIRKNASEGIMSALLTVEDGIGIDGKMERLDEMYEDGVRMLTLTWNWENSIGFPNNIDPELHKKGLKPFGIDVVHRMNELGMVVDVSHLSEGGFWDVVRESSKPFAASHSCARALRDHQRNLTDEQLKALADKGGVVGINFCSDFLSEDKKNTYAKDIVRHMIHFRDVAGIDSMAWGSDFDGIASIMDFGDYAGMPVILDLLSREFTDDEIDKINHGNFLRVLDAQK
ncbi:MAG: dipeptidase [Firmicutes bacterium]|nr:dipeptidase [Bacillota bacterium]